MLFLLLAGAPARAQQAPQPDARFKTYLEQLGFSYPTVKREP